MCDSKVGHIFPSNVRFEVYLLMNVFAQNLLLLFCVNYYFFTMYWVITGKQNMMNRQTFSWKAYPCFYNVINKIV